MKNKKIKAYGCMIGIMTRYGTGGYFIEECTPTLTTSQGDNLMSVVTVSEGGAEDEERKD